MLNEIKYKKLLRSNVDTLRRAISFSKIFQPPTVSKFVFLCGANKSINQISERRKALIEFSKRNLIHTQFFLAEKVFSTLQDEGHKGNVLDVEQLISDFADYIIIILESPSAFSELGAFANSSLRKKLIVINDIQFKEEKSFINLGPIRAIEECAGKNRILYYRMNKDGVFNRDSIGCLFHQINELLQEPLSQKSKSIDINSCNPAKAFDKNAAMFLHDLIYITGPILHKELIELLKLIFGNDSFNNVAHLLAMLVAFDSIERNFRGLYRSKLHLTYYDFRFDIFEIISMFRNYTMKSFPERLYAY